MKQVFKTCEYNIINNKLRKKLSKSAIRIVVRWRPEPEANFLLDGGSGPFFWALGSGGASASAEIFASAARQRSSANRKNLFMFF
jgi:hypothetical protein